MKNSEKMLSAIEAQDLVQAADWFEKALLEDSDSVLLDLAEYLERIGFYHQAKRIFNKLAPDFPQVNLNLATIASEDGELEEAFGYLEKIDSTDSWYVNALLIKAISHSRSRNMPVLIIGQFMSRQGSQPTRE